MLVGEAPGEQEDRHGAPFVGAAGQLLTELLSQAELDRSALYVPNAVKHRPSSPAGRGRQNRAPRQSEIRACFPWLEAEIRIIQPRVIVCLGAIAAKVILVKDFRLTKQRGNWYATLFAPQTMATLHPSYLLRQVTPETAAMTRQQVIADLREAGRRGREDRSQPAVAPEQ